MTTEYVTEPFFKFSDHETVYQVINGAVICVYLKLIHTDKHKYSF